MCDMLYTNLKIEEDTRALLVATGRKDIIAALLLARINREIEEIEEKIVREREKSDPHAGTIGIIPNVLKGMFRCKYHKDAGYNKVLSISTKSVLQTPGADR